MTATASETTGSNNSPNNASVFSQPSTGPATIPVISKKRIAGNFVRHDIQWQTKPASSTAAIVMMSCACI